MEKADKSDSSFPHVVSGHVKQGYMLNDKKDYVEIMYEGYDGYAVVCGDIIIAALDEMEKSTMSYESSKTKDKVVLRGNANKNPDSMYWLPSPRWTNAFVPYTISSDLPLKTQIRDAIAHWESKTPVKFIEFPPHDQIPYTDYIEFIKGSDPNRGTSYVGMKGGRQVITLGVDVSQRTIRHEIGHAVGLEHEHNRLDRDNYVEICWENIEDGEESSFVRWGMYIKNPLLFCSEDIGAYDYASIMHYGKYTFSKNNRPTIIPKDKTVEIGNSEVLSTGDIETVRVMYCYNSRPVTDLTVIVGDSPGIQPQQGWTKLQHDLNAGAGGKYVYLCYRTDDGDPVVDIKIIKGDNCNIPPPAGFTKISEDVNSGAGGKYIYICYRKGPGVPITNVSVISGPHEEYADPVPGLGFVKINQDLNEGSGGDFVYLCYQPDPMVPITDIFLLTGDDDKIEAPDGYYKLCTDLNKGAGGKFIYLCYKKSYDSPIVGLDMITSSNPYVMPPQGYTRLDPGTNYGNRGLNVYLCYITESSMPPGEGQEAVLDITAIVGDNSDIVAPPHYIKLNHDTNSGAGGKFIYLCYATAKTLE